MLSLNQTNQQLALLRLEKGKTVFLYSGAFTDSDKLYVSYEPYAGDLNRFVRDRFRLKPKPKADKKLDPNDPETSKQIMSFLNTLQLT